MSEPEFQEPTFDYKRSEKRKNDSEFQDASFDYKFSEKPKNDYSMYSSPERGGCLTAFLAFICVAQVFVLISMFALLGGSGQYGYSSQGIVQFAAYLQMALSIAAIACAIGLYNWKSWGYYGLLAIYAVAVIISFMVGSFSTIGGSFLGAFILVYLMREKTSYLE